MAVRNMQSENHRTQERLPIEFQVQYIHKGDYVLSFSKNISLGGMFLCVPDPPDPGSRLKLIFSVDEHYEAEVMAVVIWVDRSPRTGSTGMGVQFLSQLTPKLKENIMKQVKRVEILKEIEGSA